MRSQAGYTLVELMLIITISSILALVSAVLVITANRQMQQGLHTSNLQQDLAVISEILQNELSQGSALSTLIYTDYTTLATGPAVRQGTCIKIGIPPDKNSVIYQSGRNFAILQGGNPQYLVKDCVDSLFFYRSSGADSLRIIYVKIRLQDGSQTLATQQRFYLRN